MIFVEQEWNHYQDILWYEDYQPYRRGGVLNQDCGPDSKRIMNVKARDTSAAWAAIQYYVNLMDQQLLPGITLLYVPSSNRDKIDTGIRRVAQQVAARNNRIDATGCLVRHATIPSAKEGGPRTIEAHFNSIRLVNPHLLYGRDILILDDVTTSGSSLRACRQIVEGNARVRSIYMLALGRTV